MVQCDAIYGRMMEQCKVSRCDVATPGRDFRVCPRPAEGVGHTYCNGVNKIKEANEAVVD